jgi:hypothetical protein
MPFSVSDFILGVALPAFVSVVLSLVVGGRGDPLRARLQALFWALGFAFVIFFVHERLPFPPGEAIEALPWAALALALFVVISPHATASRYLTRAGFVVGLGLLLLWPIHDTLHGHVHMRNMAAFFFLGLGCWSILERAVIKVQSPSLIALPLISVVTLFVILQSKGGVQGTQGVAVWGVFLAGYLASVFVAPRRLSAAAVLPFVSVFVIGLMAQAHFYLHINPWLMVYICLPYLVLWIRRWIPLVPPEAIGEAVVLSLICALPLGYLVWTI